MAGIETFDDLLQELGVGKWNLTVIIAMGFWVIFIPFHSMSGAFLTPSMSYTCVLPEGGIPLTTNSTNDTSIISQCMYEVEVADGEMEERPCTNWVFDNSTYVNTLTSEFNLVCGSEFLRPSFQSIYFFGAFFGAPVNGWLADRYGRKRMLTVGSIFYTLLAIALPWLPSISAILAFRFIQGLLHPTSTQAGYSLAMEMTEPRLRSVVGILMFFPWTFAIISFGGIAYLLRDWRWLMFAVTLPSVLFLPVLWFIDESPRWLIVRGEHERALQVLQRAARLNKASLPPVGTLMVVMKNIEQQSANNNNCSKTGGSSLLIFLRGFAREVTVLIRTRRMRSITLTAYFIFMVMGMVYYGLSLSGGKFSSNPFVYMTLSGVMEIPSSSLTIPLVERLGRRNPNIGLLLITGAALISVTFTPKYLGWLVTTLALIGKLTIAAAYQIVFLQATELFPTEVRTRGIGTCSMVSKIGSISAPYVVETLSGTWSSGPAVVFGGAAILAGGMTYMLPETLGVDLPDTVAILEETAKNRTTVEEHEEETYQLFAENKEDKEDIQA